MMLRGLLSIRFGEEGDGGGGGDEGVIVAVEEGDCSSGVWWEGRGRDLGLLDG